MEHLADWGRTAIDRQARIRHEATLERRVKDLRPVPIRVTVAAALIALAVWLAPSARAAVPNYRRSVAG